MADTHSSTPFLRRWAEALAPWAFTGLIVWFMLAQVKLESVRPLLANFSTSWLLLGLASYFITNIFRDIRTWLLLGRSPKDIITLLPVFFVVSLANNSLPARMGEVSHVYLTNRVLKAGVGPSAAGLVAVRIFDYITVALMFVAAWAMSASQLSLAGEQVALIAIPAVVVGAFLLAGLPWLGTRLLAGAVRVLEWARLRRLALNTRREGQAALETLGSFRTPRLYAQMLLTSLGVWLFTYLWFACFLEAVGYHAALPLVIFGSTFAVLTKAIPLASVGGFGTHEAGWALGFSLIGFDLQAAILSGFAVNVLTLAASAVFGFPSLALLRRSESVHGPGAAGDTESLPSGSD